MNAAAPAPNRMSPDGSGTGVLPEDPLVVEPLEVEPPEVLLLTGGSEGGGFSA